MPKKNRYFNRDHPLFGSVTWEALRSLGESSMVRSSVYWIFLVPLAAKLLQGVQSPVQVRLFEQIHHINLTLPFTWYYLYFSALSFALGSLLYRIYCPPLISQFANFRDYLNSGGEGFRLEAEIEKAVPRGMIRDSAIWSAFQSTVEVNVVQVELFESKDTEVGHGLRRIPGEKLGSLFYATRSVVSYAHPGMVLSAAICFGIGIVLLCVVMVENLNFVLIQLNGGIPLVTWAA